MLAATNREAGAPRRLPAQLSKSQLSGLTYKFANRKI
jgi:hypothetical protein